MFRASSLNSFLVASSLSLAALVGCGGSGDAEASSDVGALEGERANRVTIGEADMTEAKSLADLKMFVRDPKLSARADSVVTEDSAFDGTRSITYLVKDADGRLFEVSTVTSDSRDGSRVGRHGAPPSFGDTRYFMLLNAKGIDWAIAKFSKKPSTRHAQILEAKESADFSDSVKDLGKRTVDEKERTVIHFNSSVFLVSEGGFDAKCKRENERSCADAWQRIDNGDDPFDAR